MTDYKGSVEFSPLWLKDGESIDHLFLHCDFAYRSWNYLVGLLGISFDLAQKVDDWLMEGLNAWNLQRKTKVVGSCAFRSLLWHLWKGRNARTFEDKLFCYDFLRTHVQNTSSWWITLHRKLFVIIVC